MKTIKQRMSNFHKLSLDIITDNTPGYLLPKICIFSYMVLFSLPPFFLAIILDKEWDETIEL